MYRSSTGDLASYDEPPRRGGGERWDRDRFERMSRRGGGGGGGGGGGDEHDHFRFEEHDRSGRSRRDVEIDERFDRRGPRTIERERFHEDERYGPPRRQRTDLLDEPTASEVASRALAPYRRKSVVDRDIDISIQSSRRPARPQYIRRQSSLDTFDRRPLPRYGDIERIEREREREEWRPPANMPIPLPIRERHRSPSRRFREEDFEEIRYRDSEPREEYREVEVRREKSTHRRSRSRAAKSAKSVRSSSSSSFEDVAPPKQQSGKRGKTRMPKRLVKKEAIVELGYPYEEEDDFLIVQRALGKEQIDEVIKVSENYKEQKTTYVYEDQESFQAPPPPPPPPPETYYPPPPSPPPPETHYPPPPPSVAHSFAPSHAPSHHTSHHAPSHHPHERELFEERIEESNHIGGPLTVLVPEERRIVRNERDIKDEIRALETERRMLKYEREGDYEVIERIERREPKREIVRIEKDRKGRLALVKSAR